MKKRSSHFFNLLLLLVTGTGLLSCASAKDKIITAIVLDSQTNQPIHQAVLEVNDTPTDITLTREADQETGVFEIRLAGDSLKEETVVVQLKATAPGYLPVTHALSVPQEQEHQEVRINLEPKALVGQVTDARTDEPLPVTIYLSHGQMSAEQVEQIETDMTGRFSVLRLEPPLTLQVVRPGYELWQTTLDAPDLFTNEATHHLEIELIPRTTRGMLSDAGTAEPLAGVTLRAGSEDRQQTATTDTAGTFEFHRLLAGDRIIVETPPEYFPAEVTFNGEDELTLALQPRQLTITVLDNFTDQPAVGAKVTLTQTMTATTNAQGQVTFTRIAASGQISVTRPGYQPVTVDYQDDDSLAVTLIPKALRGVVRDGQTGRPLPWATLSLNDAYLQATEEGYFVLENLPATPQPLMVKTAGYHRAYAQLGQSGIFTATTPPPFSGGEGQWLVTAPCAEPFVPPASPCFDFILSPFHVKAIYIPFHYLRSRELMNGYLDFVQATELNAIVVDVKGDFGFIGWESEVELAETVGADERRTDTWMPLAELIAEAKKRNIYTVARFVVFKDDPLAHGKPELAAVREDGSVWIDGEELGWANPFKEEVWDYNIALAEEVAAFGFNELNFDYIRFPSDGNVGEIVYEEENTRETRTLAIREFMQRLTEALRPYGVFISADVFGLTIWVTPESDMNIGQRIIDIAPYVDYLAPMVYPSTFIPGNLGYDNPSAEPYGVVFRSQNKAEELVPPYVKVRPWLQGYWYSLEEMQLLKQAAIDAESTGWSWWNAGGKYDDELFEPVEVEEE